MTAGHTEGRRGASRARQTRTKGERGREGTRHGSPRTHDRIRRGGQAEGRKTGERNTDGLAPGGAEKGNGEKHGSRGTEQGENEKEIYKYLRERREKKRR